MPRPLCREEYTVGWVCALHIELAAAQEMLDDEHDPPPRNAYETNIYTCGRIGEHNVVIACLPEGQMGTNSAAAVAMQLKSAFPATRFGLMVGIGGGVPSEEADIRLGDVVVSKPHKSYGGVVQYNMGKATPSGFERTGSLNAPPTVLLNAIANLRAKHTRGRSQLLQYISKLDRLPDFTREAAGVDILFQDEYDHVEGGTCERCSKEYAVVREARVRNVTVHYGTIASGDQIIRDAAERNRISAAFGGVLCFEMEAAGLMNSFPCLVIRGVCDYADSHKNKRWQAYAAGTAAAYAKELLSVIPAADVMTTRRMEEVTSVASTKHFLQSQTPGEASSKRRRVDMPSSTIGDIAVQQRERDIRLFFHQAESEREHQRTLPNDEQKRNLLDSLKFVQIDARQSSVKTAHARTCKWLLNNDQYRDWHDTTKLNEHHGFFWIKGKAGTGKSTLMKFALTNARKTMKDCVVISFFFNARGENIEKETIGTYRSLLLQLLEHIPALQNTLDLTLAGFSSPNISPEHQWSIEPLKALLEQAIQGLGKSTGICFIDALDECDDAMVWDMLQFFEHIGKLVVSKGISFQVCFSSRHYPNITITRGLELELEGQEGHTQDITNYVETELKIGKSKIAQQVRAKLQEKASGIFMWVVLVVRILNKESARGKDFNLQRKLQEIPADLFELFLNILTRDSYDKDYAHEKDGDKAALISCIQWVLFANQPLSPEQLYHAILSGIQPEALTGWDPKEITEDVIKRFILDSSKGLVEATKSKKPTVQFIHESVRDFLLKENSLNKVWPELGSNFDGRSHESLKQCCANYININDATFSGIPDEFSQLTREQVADMRRPVMQAFPLLEYAVHNVLYHANSAQGSGISQQSFLDSFSLPRFTRLHNLFEQHQIRRHPENVTYMYILAELNMANLIKVLSPSAAQCLEVENARYGSPLFAAAATGSDEVLQLFIKSIRANQATYDTSGTENVHQFQHTQIQLVAKPNFVYSKAKGRLMCALKFENDEFLALLICSTNLETYSEHPVRTRLFRQACRDGNLVVLRAVLLVDPTMVDSKDDADCTPLYIAVEKRDKAMVAMLLDRGAEVNAQGGEYGNALQAASRGGFMEVVAMLLDRGANVNAQGGIWGNALQAALTTGSTEVVTMLLDRGVDVNAQSGDFGSALQAASRGGFKEIVAMLLDKGADVNAQGGYFGNALIAASLKGCKEIVAMLLDKGANINAGRGVFGNALHAARLFGNEEVETLLLSKGAVASE